MRLVAPTLRIAARQVLRSWRQSLLIALLIVLPVAGMSTAATLITSTIATTDETITHQLGKMQAWISVISPPDTSLTQSATDPSYYQFDTDENGNPTHQAANATPVTPQQVLPQSTAVLPISESSATIQTNDGITKINTTMGQSWDSNLVGRYLLASGRAPTADNEIALSAHALNRLGANVGSTVAFTDPAKTLTVVGVMRSVTDTNDTDRAFGTTEALTSSQSVTALRYYLPDLALGATEVRALNAKGIVVFSRELMLNPPAADAGFLTYGYDNTSYAAGSVASLLLTIAVFMLFEVGLLAGAAFTVSARTAQRELAVVASVGATRRSLFTIISWHGVVLGLVGGLVGSALGIGIAFGGISLFGNGSVDQFPGFHVPWLVLLGVVVFAALAGWIAAAVPAWQASRMDVVRALRGARKPHRPSRLLPILGVLVLAVGVVLNLISIRLLHEATDDVKNFNQDLYSGAAILTVVATIVIIIGLVLGVPLIIDVLARLIGRGALAARLGGRDVARNRGRTVPIIAAILATAVGASMVITIIGSADELQRRTWSGSDLPGQMMVYLPLFSSSTINGTGVQTIIGAPSSAQAEADGKKIVEVAKRTLPGADVRIVHSVTTDAFDFTSTDELITLAAPLSNPMVPAANACPLDPYAYTKAWYADPRCVYGQGIGEPTNQQSMLVGTTDDLATITGIEPSVEVKAALSAGKPVALNPLLLDADGTLTFGTWPEGRTQDDPDSSQQGTSQAPMSFGKPSSTKSWSTVAATSTVRLNYAVFMTEETARSLGFGTYATKVIMTKAGGFTQTESDKLWGALRSAFPDADQYSVWPSIQDGPSGPLGTWLIVGIAALIGLVTTTIALALARSDSKGDDAVLASIGATGALRRRIAVWQALFITGIACVTGVLVGLVPAYVLSSVDTQPPMVVPWNMLAAIAIGIPLVSAVGAFVFTRSRMQYRAGASIA